MFEVGQQVVRIRCGKPTSHGEKVPAIGGVYTIRNFAKRRDGKIGLRLEEIINKPRFYSDLGYEECAFCPDTFRPVRKTDISIFTALLVSSPIKEKVCSLIGAGNRT